jgi:protein-S-isoprenylcysteine O-methyltransferase Ste14
MTQRILVLAGGLVLFSLLHSVLAVERVRRRGERVLGGRPRLYRGLYSVLAVGLLVATLQISRGDWPIVWRAQGAPRLALLAVEVVALVGFVASVARFDVPQFLGLTARARPDTSEPLRTDGVYRLCRHPLYFFTGLAFSAWPTMDLRWLVVAVWLWAYSWIGSEFEERKLLAMFGDAYRRYRDTHWRLLPFGPKRAPLARA